MPSLNILIINTICYIVFVYLCICVFVYLYLQEQICSWWNVSQRPPSILLLSILMPVITANSCCHNMDKNNQKVIVALG